MARTGHIAWDQSFPDRLHLRLLDGTDQTLHRGGKLSPYAKAATRLVAGLPEGFIEGFANLYRDYAEQIVAHAREARARSTELAGANRRDGVEGLAFVDAVLKSAQSRLGRGSAGKAFAIGRNSLGIDEIDRQIAARMRSVSSPTTGAHALHGFLGDAGEMRRQDHIVEAEKRMIGRQRLRREDIERGAAEMPARAPR